MHTGKINIDFDFTIFPVAHTILSKTIVPYATRYKSFCFPLLTVRYIFPYPSLSSQSYILNITMCRRCSHERATLCSAQRCTRVTSVANERVRCTGNTCTHIHTPANLPTATLKFLWLLWTHKKRVRCWIHASRHAQLVRTFTLALSIGSGDSESASRYVYTVYTQ